MRGFARWGYPDALRLVAGAVEVVAAVLLLVPRAAFLGAAALAPVMVAAASNLLSAPAMSGHVASLRVAVVALAAAASSACSSEPDPYPAFSCTVERQTELESGDCSAREPVRLSDPILAAGVHAALGGAGGPAPIPPCVAAGIVNVRLRGNRLYVHTLDGLERLPNLRSLSFPDSRIEDLGPLRGARRLTSLDVSGNPALADLSPLAELPELRALDASRTVVRDLAPLAEVRTLRTLLVPYTRVSDLGPLRQLPLEELTAYGNDIADLTPLSRDLALRVLDVGSNHVPSLAPLAGLTGLEELRVGVNPISDLAPLAGLPRLRVLQAAATRVTSLEPLRGLAELEWVWISNAPIDDLGPLAGKVHLWQVNVYETNVRSLLPLADLPRLEEVVAHQTPLDDRSRGEVAAALRARGVRVSL